MIRKGVSEMHRGKVLSFFSLKNFSGLSVKESISGFKLYSSGYFFVLCIFVYVHYIPYTHVHAVLS